MALNFQLLQFPFRFGIAEGTDPHAVPPGTLTVAENAVWRKGGRIEKRYGTSALTTATSAGGTLSAAARLFTRGTQLCVVDGTSLYAYSEATSKWAELSRVPDVGLTWEPLLDTSEGVSSADCGLGTNGAMVVAWRSGDPTGTTLPTGHLFVEVVDRTTGATLVSPTEITDIAVGVRVLVSGTTAFVVYATDDGAGDRFIRVLPIDLVALAPSFSVINLRNDLASDNIFAALLVDGNIVIAYPDSANDLKLYSYSYTAPSTFTQLATGGITSETGTAFHYLDMDGVSGESLYLVYFETTGQKVRFAAANASTLVETVAPVDLETGVVAASFNALVKRLSATTVIAGYTVYDNTAATHRATTKLLSNAGAITTSATRGTYHTQWISRPFVQNGKTYAALSDYPYATSGTSSPFPGTVTYLVEIETDSKGGVLDFIPHRYVGKIEQTIGGVFRRNGLSSPMTVSATETDLVVPLLVTAPPKVSNWRQGLKRVSVTCGASAPLDLWRGATYGSETYVAGAVLSAFDGRILFDYGASRAPFLRPQTTGAGGGMAAGSYLYAVVQEFRSAAGVLHRSMTGVSQSAAVVGALGKATVTPHVLGMQTKQTLDNGGIVTTATPVPINFAVYRTTVGATGALQRLTYEPSYNTIKCEANGATASLVDTVADADIGGSVALSTRPAIYTAGGILEDEAPPAFTTMLLHKQRLWGVDGSGRQVWYSKSFLDDQGVAPGFSASFRQSFDQPITALASLDEKLIAFWAGGVYVLYGGDQGPLPTGNGSDLQGPMVVQSDVGCINPRSVVSTPDGVMFQSARGLFLLTRKLEVTWIGRPVQDTLEAYPNITSAVLVAKRSEIRFTANNAAGAAGVVLVYNYVEGQWSTSKYTAGGFYGAAIADACMWNGVWTFATPTGRVYEESEATYRDGGAAWVPLTLTTAWISAAGPVAYQSVRNLQLAGVANTNHQLTIAAAFDSDATIRQTHTFVDGSAVTTIGPLEECLVSIGTRRKCSAIQFTISDAAPATLGVGTGQGPSLHTMGLEVGGKKGFVVVPATKTG